MKLIPILLTTTVLTASGYALAERCHDGPKRDHFRSEYMQNLTDEERSALKATKEKMKQMSREERRAFKNDTKEEWESLSADEQDAFIAQHQDKIERALEHKKKQIVLRLYGMSQLNK